jgi:hypothetical protein
MKLIQCLWRIAMHSIKYWIIDRSYDFYWWIKDRPFTRCWRGFKDRIDVVLFCLMLLIVGIYSPRSFRKLIIDSINNKK